MRLKQKQRMNMAARRKEKLRSIEEDSEGLRIIPMGHNVELREEKSIVDLMTACTNGDVEQIQKFLESQDNDARLFVQGQTNGKTMLILAAAEKSAEMVSLLIEHGADVNASDSHGRTALMEAALFGRVDNVRILLSHSANKDLRDEEDRRAIDFARTIPRNRREVYDRTAHEYNIKSATGDERRLARVENTLERDRDRKEILYLLGAEYQRSKIVFGSPPTLSQSHSYSFGASSVQSSVTAPEPVAEHSATKQRKPVAHLERGGKFTSVAAMSKGPLADSSVETLRVDGRQWTDDVFYISDVVGHNLSSNDEDQDRKGQYAACHAVKQLIAYFIDRHVFLPRDSLPDPHLEERMEDQEDKLEELFSSTKIGRQVSTLRVRKKILEYWISEDEKLVDKHDEIEKLQSLLKSVEKTLDEVMNSRQGEEILNRECLIEALSQQQCRRNDLIHMANAPPPASLKEAAILVSSNPCSDCIEFTDKVNNHFGLSIQLFSVVSNVEQSV